LPEFKIKKGKNMSTVAVTPSTDIAIKPENIEYKVYVKLDGEGKVIEKETVYSSSAKQIEKLDAEVAKPDASIVLAKAQTVKTYKVGSIEGLRELIGDEEEAVNIINRGLAQKFNQKISEYLTDFDSTKQAFVNDQTDEVFDSKELLQEPTQRRNLSPTEKLAKAVKNAGFDEATILALLASLQASTPVAE
jgi:hypothetical protein